MTTTRATPTVAGGSTTRPSLLARRPELAPVAATVLAWVALAATAPLSAWTLSGPVPGSDDGHLEHGVVFSLSGVLMVALMTVAMMAPLALPGVRTVAFTSLWWRAGRAVLWFFVLFSLTWMVIAVVLAPFAGALGLLLGDPATAAGILLLTCAAAQFDPRRTALAASCDRPMRLRSTGADANVDCARFGVLTAWRGVRLCALPMVAMLALPSSLLLMALLTAGLVADRITLGRRRVVIAAGYAVIGAVLLI